jgi:RNA polymerase sigma-70 factor (ECF subfamily)
MAPLADPEMNLIPSSGDDWFVTVLVPAQSRLYRYIAALVPNRADAEDLFQKTCLTAWQERRRFEAGRDFFAWLCGVARNHIRHHYRGRQRSPVGLDPTVVEQLAERLAEQDDYFQRREAALSSCLDKLPMKQRRLVEGYYRREQSIKDLAVELGCAVEAAYKALQRVRAALQECISLTLAREGCP